MKNFEKLQRLLEELFQLDQADLDFGIYRIMNQKRDEVVRFLEKDLLPQVKEAFGEFKSADKVEVQKELDKTIKQATALGVDPEVTTKVKELREQYEESTVDVISLENEVFSHLYSFFRRYYHEGDFLSLRRYKAGVYAIPYEGEEVKLHWANHDQYYIKSSEYLRDFAFKLTPSKRVRFKVVSGSTEQDNKKEASGKERRFVLCSEDPMIEENGELIIRFEYRPDEGKLRQDALNKAAVENLLSASAGVALGKDGSGLNWTHELAKTAPTKANPNRTLLEKHLTHFTARNTFDYFIHKDLGGFLRRELDFYIKNEVMHLDDIEHDTVPRVEQYLSKIKVIRRIAHKIIAFLEQLENFQKKLWLKKKFVVETNYCITLDRVPEELYPEIAANDAQRGEWVRLFAIDSLDKFTVPLTNEFLTQNPHLILDTCHFSSTFILRLFKDERSLHELTDGLLIESDSFHGMNLIATALKKSVQCVYFDPPYNTGIDGFVYKDSFQHSTWASFLYDRLMQVRSLLSQTGVVFASINEIERTLLDLLLVQVLGRANRIEELIWIQDTVRNNSPTYSTNHEYIEVYSYSRPQIEGRDDMFREPKSGFDEIIGCVTELNKLFSTIADARLAIKEVMQVHRREYMEEQRERGVDPKEAKRNDPWKGIYPYRFLEYRTVDGVYVTEEQAALHSAKLRVFREVDPSMPSGKQSQTTRDPSDDNFRFYLARDPKTGLQHVHPKRGWAFPQKAIGKRPSLEGYIEDNRIVFKDSPSMPPQIKYFLHEVSDMVSTSVIRQYSDGEQELDSMFGRKGIFPNPKPVNLVKRLVGQTCPSKNAIILDFLAGSATTAHAVLRGNIEEGKQRRFIAIEMGNYFSSVTLPRTKMACCATTWQNGRPVIGTGLPCAFKYIRLESYEDALNNLELRRTEQQSSLLAADDHLHEQFILSYMLDIESRGSQSLLNLDAIRKPDEYKLKVERNGETQLQNVDLVETFNWLLGLTVRHIDVIRGVRTVEGTNPVGDRVLVLWRDLDKTDNSALDAWFEKQGYNTKDQEYDLLYVNGDNHLENLRRPDQTWKVRLIEEEFGRLMFDTEDQ